MVQYTVHKGASKARSGKFQGAPDNAQMRDGVINIEEKQLQDMRAVPVFWRGFAGPAIWC